MKNKTFHSKNHSEHRRMKDKIDATTKTHIRDHSLSLLPLLHVVQ